MAWWWWGSKRVAGAGVDLDDLVALQRTGELAERGMHALDHLGGRCARYLITASHMGSDGGLKTVFHWQQALGEGLHGELAGLGHLFFAASPHIFDSALARR